MQSELKSLSKLFSESIFRIPDYQRGYAWQEKQVKDFWLDITQLEEGKNHYTGVLTLEPVQQDIFQHWNGDTWIINAKKYTPLYVVDGQQRLTTSILLMHAIIEKLKDNEELNFTSKSDIRKRFIFESKDGGISRSYIFGYEKDNPSHEYLKQRIFGEGSENHAPIEETIYTRNLLEAKDFFKKMLLDLDLQQTEKIYTKLTQNILFNIFYIEKDLDVFVTFETMNNRGKLLSRLELLKNRLIYLSTKVDAEEYERKQLRSTINESWKSIYHFLGKNQLKPLNDDVFLRTHFFLYFGDQISKAIRAKDDSIETSVVFRRFSREDYYKDYLLEEIFNPRNLKKETTDEATPITTNSLHNYSLDIKNTVQLYYQIATPSDSVFSPNEKIWLERINRLTWYPGRLMTVAIFQQESSAEKRINILEVIERFGFLLRFRPGYFSDISLDEFTLELKNGKIECDEIQRKMQQYCDNFSKSPEFHESITLIGKERGYYTWNPLRYFMFEYEQWLRHKSKATRGVLDWETFQNEDYEADHKSIEHIYPQKPTNTYWKDRFNHYSVKERGILRNSLGNLLPLSQPKNASLSNKSFDEKKGNSEQQVGYKYGCLSEVQVSESINWTPIDIVKRGLRLLDFMEERWKVQLGSKEDKIKVLGLSFVVNREAAPIDSL
jgi:uncharacterized protein with ParB-like and HNH nuclease domain